MNAPTDLELMMFADGELPEPRCSEVARFLAGDGASEGGESARAAASKLDGLALVGHAARHHADRVATVHRADDLASLVMARIESGDLEKSEAPRLRERERKVAPLEPSASLRSADRPANDNHGLIYGLAALAAAAAVALGFWGRSAPSDPRVAGREPIVHEVPSQLPALPSGEVAVTRPAPSATTGAPEADADEPSVKVASVNFGANTGTIYYVPKDTPGTTTVVWLAER